MKTLGILALCPFLFASCASDEPTPSAAAPARKSMNERFGGGGRDPDSFSQDANGKIIAGNSKRSQFENRKDSNFANKDFKTQEYKAGDYAKKSWWGNKEYTPKAYAGKTDGSRFQKASALDGQGARESGNAAAIPAAYATSNYATNAAREAGNSPIQKSSNAEIENRQQDFEQPEIIHWRAQRDVTMDQAKGILGR